MPRMANVRRERDERGVPRMAKEEKEVMRLSASTPHMPMFANNALLGG